MNRRTVLGTAGASMVGFTAGCLGDGIDYQRCDAEFVPRRELPEEPSNEAKTSLEEGAYTTVRKLVYPEIVEDDATLWDESENRYYEHEVEVDDWLSLVYESTLTFTEITPSVDSTGDLLVSNQTADELEVSISVSAEGGKPVIEETVRAGPTTDIDAIDAIEPGAAPGSFEDAQSLPSVAFPTELADYEVTVEVEGMTETETVNVTPWFAYYWVQVTEDNLLVGVVRKGDEFFSEEITSKAGIHAECLNLPSGWPRSDE